MAPPPGAGAEATAAAHPPPPPPSNIERETGCNKVVCTVCSTAMCWACGLEYYKAAGHAYPAGAWTCNKPPAAFRGSATGDDMQRFSHFRARVASSAQSADIAAREAPAVAARAEELYALVGRAGALPELRVADLDFFARGLAAVRAGREFLRASYMRAFSLADEREAALFADQQSVLEATVEKLQQAVESSAVARVGVECANIIAAGGGGGSGGGGSGGGGGGGGGGAPALRPKLEALRVEVLSLIRTVEVFTANLTESVGDAELLFCGPPQPRAGGAGAGEAGAAGEGDGSDGDDGDGDGDGDGGDGDDAEEG